jgi:hypothetical protein
VGGLSQARAEAHRAGLVTDVGEEVGNAVTTLEAHEGEIEEVAFGIDDAWLEGRPG